MIHSLYIPFPKSYLKFINLMRAIAIFPIALIFSLESSFYTNKSLFQLLIYETEYALSPFATKYSITYFPVEHTPADLQSCNSCIQSCHSSFTKLVQLCPLHLCSVCQFILTDSLFFNHFIQLDPDAAIIQIFHILLPSTTILFRDCKYRITNI